LDRVLRLCIATWEGDMDSLSANMLSGIARLVISYDEQMKDEVFKEKLGDYSIKEIKRIAVDRHTGSLGFAEAMLICYNKKMKFGLRWGNLYSPKGRKPEVEIPELDVETDDSDLTDEPIVNSQE
jgi:hypothetical protein